MTKDGPAAGPDCAREERRRCENDQRRGEIRGHSNPKYSPRGGSVAEEEEEKNYSQARSERGGRERTVEEVLGESFVGHELGDEESLISFTAAAD